MRFLLLLSAASAVFLCSSCSMLIRQDPPPPQKRPGAETPAKHPDAQPAPPPKAGQAKDAKTLTDRDIAAMSPDELERYMEEKRRKESAQSFSKEMAEGKLSEHDRRQIRENVTRPMAPEERGSAFPWKSEPGTRSESLRDTRTFRH